MGIGNMGTIYYAPTYVTNTTVVVTNVAESPHPKRPEGIGSEFRYHPIDGSWRSKVTLHPGNHIELKRLCDGWKLNIAYDTTRKYADYLRIEQIVDGKVTAIETGVSMDISSENPTLRLTLGSGSPGPITISLRYRQAD